MKRNLKSLAGVTLLEIMLVLAIASMVIVMSIRYYQSASLNQKINAAVNNVTGIMAAAESYLASAGTFSGFNSAAITPYLPGNKMPPSPWGGTMAIVPGSANSYSINIANVPTTGCTQLLNLLKTNSKITGSSCTAILVTE